MLERVKISDVYKQVPLDTTKEGCSLMDVLSNHTKHQTFVYEINQCPLPKHAILTSFSPRLVKEIYHVEDE